jgi:hypothetical protein
MRLGRERHALLVQTQQHLERGNNGPSIERDLGERDDGDAQAHEKSQSAGVAGLHEDIGGDFVADRVAEHEQACDGCCCIEDPLRHSIVGKEGRGKGRRREEGVKEVTYGEGKGDFEGLGVFVGVAHVAIDLEMVSGLLAPGVG